MDKILEQHALPWLEYNQGLDLSDDETKYFSNHFVCTTIYEKSNGDHYGGVSTFVAPETMLNHDLTLYRFAIPAN